MMGEISKRFDGLAGALRGTEEASFLVNVALCYPHAGTSIPSHLILAVNKLEKIGLLTH
jgi:hypothetical protein